MQSHKRYSNVSFTKRVDHDAGRHRGPRAPAEPAECETCGAVYRRRRWISGSSAKQSAAPTHQRRFRQTVCPACRQELTGTPRGHVYLDGAFVALHEEDIRRLLDHEAERAALDNPLARLMGRDRTAKGGLTLTTTTEHLAKRLGHALEKAFGGKVRYRFGHENKLARVWWRRD